MASHHHSCYPPSPYIPTPNPIPTCHCHCSYATYTGCYRHPPPPPPVDPHPHYHHPPPQADLLNLHNHHPRFGERYVLEDRQPHPTVSVLLRRIAALEASLRGRSSSSSHSLRDAAARTIQTHFRAFLVRRSRTLRQLKDLASIKSTLAILKSSVSGRTPFDFEVVYNKAVNLLLRLDVIQSGDSMIRDGKNSLIRELNKFFDSIESFCVETFSNEEHGTYRRNTAITRALTTLRKIENGKCGGPKRVNVEKLRGLAQRIDKLAEELDEEEIEVMESPNACGIRKGGVSTNRNGVLIKPRGEVRPEAKKTVTFAENGKVYRILRREPFVDEDCGDSIENDDLVVDGERELEDREIEEIGVSSKEAEDDDEDEAHSDNEGKASNLVFSAPLHVKMGARNDLVHQMKNQRKN